MKKIFLALAFLLMTGSAFSQVDLYTRGVTHNIADAYLSAADSLHYLGFFEMRDGTSYIDSVNINVETNDSLNIRILLVPVKQLGTETIADSVGVGFAANVATGGYQFTAAGFGVVPWHNILAGLTQHKARVASYKVYARVYAVGSEVASSGKKFKTTVVRFK